MVDISDLLLEETCSPMEVGFEYVGKIHGAEVLRRRK